MVVRFECPDLGLDGNEDVVLKVFDRRFAYEARQCQKVSPWSLEIENAYNEFIQTDLGAEFVNAVQNKTEEPSRDQATENSSHHEARLQHLLCGIMLPREVKAYDALKDLQGKVIPRLIAKVTVPGGDLATPEVDKQGFPGIVMEFIPGFPLSDLAEFAPRELWQPICDHAIQIINLIGDRGILNEDVQTRSFIVKLDSTCDTGYKISMIDFGFCAFRDEYDDERTWTKAKCMQREEEVIGRQMEQKLEGGFVYNESGRWRRPSSYY